ncbi:MAG TPA: efflux RND transporter periplasmic adaptor subunit [Patescibacteria group bacterium]|nr:efflux RND transporter periplasmic adaptor subunit [Patescibacteria group bacterium]
MKRWSRLYCVVIAVSLVVSCGGGDNGAYHYNGRIDVELIRLAAEATGRIDSVAVDEGDPVRKGQLLVRIDTERLEAELRRQEAQLEEVRATGGSVQAQMRQVRSERDLARETLKKTETMLTQGAATTQTRDELKSRVDVFDAQLEALRSNLSVLEAKERQLEATTDVTRIAMDDARVTSPVGGVVINRLVNPGEHAAPGARLLEIADLGEMEATIYIPLTELNAVTLGRGARVLVDGVDRTFPATVAWISSEAEFTPKTILTEETRTSLVYAVKLRVPNPDGIFKIGMPVEVVLDNEKRAR